MNQYITFRPADKELPGQFCVSVTTSAYNQLQEDTEEPENILCAISKNNRILMTNGKYDEEYYIHTEYGVFFCSPNEDYDSFVLRGFDLNKLQSQSNAMKYGVGFIAPEYKVIIQCESEMDSYHVYLDGRIKYIDSGSYSSLTSGSKKTLQFICSQMSLAERTDDNDEDEDEPKYKPHRKLAEYLDIAENYSQLADQLEKNKINEIGQISYRDIKTAPDYDRKDRVAYTLLTDEIDENEIKSGTNIDILDKLDKSHGAEIVSVEKIEEGCKITILLTKQLDINLLNNVGYFTLSYSSTIRNVQQNAIDKIRAGEAPAKYMDNVFGLEKPSGFTKKDLTKLKAELDAQDPSPNISQVKAIESGIQTNDVFLVMGPPGTGKTTVISEWAKYFVNEEHKRVLVSSQNNKAVDNVLSRLGEEKDIDVIRIGSEAKVQADVTQYLFENKIHSKREEIVSTTQNNLYILNDLYNQWSNYHQILRQQYSDGKDVYDKLNDFQSAVSHNIVPLYADLQNLIKTDESLKEKKKITNQSIHEIFNLIEDALTTEKVFKKLVGKIKHRSRVSKLNQLADEYDRICQQETETVNAYNEKIDTFQTLLSNFYNGIYTNYFDSHVKWLYNSRDIVHQKPNIENMWSLLSNIEVSNSVLSNSNSFGQLLHSIQFELQKVQKLTRAISDWHDVAQDQQNYALKELILDSVNLVGATCIGVSSQDKFADLTFDVTIIDEAGQIQIHNALVPMSVSNKLIMLGDHKQIPPSVEQEMLDICEKNDVSTELLEKSLFETMYEFLPASNKIMLDTQYRMPSEIADTISEWFYDGNYYSGDNKKNLSSILPALSHRPYVIIDTSSVKNRFETKIPEAGSYNELEASIVFELIQYIVTNYPDITLDKIGVISALKAQVKLIKSKLETILDKEQVHEMVATLDSFQGQERNIIIYSFTRSSTVPPKIRRIGFLNELRRLNVAMTRPKKMLILIGDMPFLSSCEHMDIEDGQPIYDKSEKQFSDFIKKMLSDVKSGSGELIGYSEFINRLSIINDNPNG